MILELIEEPPQRRRSEDNALLVIFEAKHLLSSPQRNEGRTGVWWKEQ